MATGHYPRAYTAADSVRDSHPIPFSLSCNDTSLNNTISPHKVTPFFIQINTFLKIFILFGEFGPYFGIGIFGKIKLESEGESLTVDTFSEKGGVKRFDMGLGFRFGAEINKLIPISIGYDFGLTNINNDNNGKFKNSNLMVSIGYKF